MDLKQFAISTLLILITSIISSLVIFAVRKIEGVGKVKKFIYSYLGAVIPIFMVLLFTSDQTLNIALVFIIEFAGSYFALTLLKNKISTTAGEETILELKKNPTVNYNMVAFIKQKLNITFIIIYYLCGTLTIVLPMFMNIKLDSGFQNSDFVFIFFLNLLPSLCLFLISFDIRNNLFKNETVKFSNYLKAVILGSLLIGITLIPILFLMLFISSKFNIINSLNSTHENFILNIVLFPIYYFFIVYATGAYTCILLSLRGNFNILEAFGIFKKPFLSISLKWIFIFFALPSIIRIISFKFSPIPTWVNFSYYYLMLTCSLGMIYLLMYLVKLRKIEN